jgi:hypothetical protein
VRYLLLFIITLVLAIQFSPFLITDSEDLFRSKEQVDRERQKDDINIIESNAKCVCSSTTVQD